MHKKYRRVRLAFVLIFLKYYNLTKIKAYKAIRKINENYKHVM